MTARYVGLELEANNGGTLVIIEQSKERDKCFLSVGTECVFFFQHKKIDINELATVLKEKFS